MTSFSINFSTPFCSKTHYNSMIYGNIKSGSKSVQNNMLLLKSGAFSVEIGKEC